MKSPATISRLSIYASTIACLAAISSCNPDPNNPDPDPTVSTYPSGILQIERIVYAPGVVGPNSDTIDHAEAYFTSTPGDTSNLNLVNAGTVLYNNDSLYADFASADTADWIYEFGFNFPGMLPTNVPSIWTVTGSAAIPPFTYTHAGTRPSLIAPLPDTLHTTTGWTVNFSTFISGADSVNIQLVGSTTLEKSALASTGSITFSPADLQSLQSANAYVYITGYSFANEVINGKRFWFIKDLIVFDYLELVP